MTKPMAIRPLSHRLASAFLLVAVGTCLTACDTAGINANSEPVSDRPRLGLMTSLPLYWSAGTGIAEFAAGEGEVPWQRQALERDFDLVPLDTLSPIPGLTDDAAETDPLEGLSRLAIVQPRGLSPADNVALDEWVTGGGQLLLVLDPMLSGHYEFALGDPRRPVDTALIPPVVERWGLQVLFDAEQEPSRAVALDGLSLPVAFAGEVREIAGKSGDCDIAGDGVIAKCRVGEGRVIILADAAIFEHGDGHDHHGNEGEEASRTEEKASAIQALVRRAFGQT